MISADFASIISEVHGKAGRYWLGRLPGILDDCCQMWSLKLYPPFPNLTYNYVAPAQRQDSQEVILKAGVLKNGQPDKELVTEINTLRQNGGQGMIQILESDLTLGVFLLERIRPGDPLRALQLEDNATKIAAAVMKRLWFPAPPINSFPTVDNWADGLKRLRNQFDGGYGPFPSYLVNKAESLFSELIDSMGDELLLHGDLHHDNILRNGKQSWVAIDPKGVIGEAAYETGAFLRNIPDHGDEEQTTRHLKRAIDQLSEYLDQDKQRIKGWGFAQAVLSAWWQYEDHGAGWELALNWAERFQRLE